MFRLPAPNTPESSVGTPGECHPSLLLSADVKIVHELHRRRIFYSPWATVLLARQHPSLHFTAVWSLPCTVHFLTERVDAQSLSPLVAVPSFQHPANQPVSHWQDFSHFTVVCEAGPGDPCLDEAVREIVPRVHHIHARIGYENSPQVPIALQCPS